MGSIISTFVIGHGLRQEQVGSFRKGKGTLNRLPLKRANGAKLHRKWMKSWEAASAYVIEESVPTTL